MWRDVRLATSSNHRVWSRFNFQLSFAHTPLSVDYLLVDTHPGVNEETLLSIAISDVLLLLLRPDKQDFQGMSVTVELARRLSARRIMLLLNKVPPDIDTVTLRQRVERTYGVPVVGLFPLSV